MTAENSTNGQRSIRHLKATTELRLPRAGVTAIVRRPPLAAWVAGGKMPDRLLSLFAGSVQGGPMEFRGGELKDLFAFGVDLAKETFVWPRIVDEASDDSDDELEPGQIPLEDLAVFLNWVFQGSVGVNVSTTSGEVSAEALGNFRPDGQLHGTGADSSEVRAATVDASGNP